MRKCLILAFLMVATVRADVTTDEAKKRLDENQKKREAERSQVVQITAGELQDLRNRVASLQAEVTALRAQAVKQAAGPAVVKKKFDKIDVGMTREEVTAFIDQHAKEFRVSSVNVKTPGAAAAVQTIKRSGAEGTNLAGTGTVEQTEASVVAPKHEVIELEHFVAVRVAVGTHQGEFGKMTYTDYDWQYQKAGFIFVTLDADVVTGVNASAR